MIENSTHIKNIEDHEAQGGRAPAGSSYGLTLAPNEIYITCKSSKIASNRDVREESMSSNKALCRFHTSPLH